MNVVQPPPDEEQHCLQEPVIPMLAASMGAAASNCNPYVSATPYSRSPNSTLQHNSTVGSSRPTFSQGQSIFSLSSFVRSLPTPSPLLRSVRARQMQARTDLAIVDNVLQVQQRAVAANVLMLGTSHFIAPLPATSSASPAAVDARDDHKDDGGGEDENDDTTKTAENDDTTSKAADEPVEEDERGGGGEQRRRRSPSTYKVE
ncbi:unnamed protein product, partial [Amoebophrya sp. A25]|eukprot:GSA25T00002979001.1